MFLGIDLSNPNSDSNTVMNIDNLIEQLINLKAQGVEELKVVNDNWDDFELEVCSAEDAHEDDKTTGFLIVTPYQYKFEN